MDVASFAGAFRLTSPIRLAPVPAAGPNPSFGTLVTTQDHGELEFLLKFGRS